MAVWIQLSDVQGCTSGWLTLVAGAQPCRHVALHSTAAGSPGKSKPFLRFRQRLAGFL